MGVDVQNDLLSPSNLAQTQDRMREQDFALVLGAFERMPPEGKRKFLEGLATKDAHFNDLYTQLRSYFWKEIRKIPLKKSQETGKTPTSSSSNVIENIGSKDGNDISDTKNQNLAGMSEYEHLEKDKDFSKYKHLFEQRNINGNHVTLIRSDVMRAFSRFESNKEPLAKCIGYDKELEKATQNYQENIRAASNMIYAPQNIDASKSYAEKQFREVQKKIIELTSDAFVSLLKNTDLGRTILQNSLAVYQHDALMGTINKNIGNTENTESPLSESIANKTNGLVGKLSTLQGQLGKDIADFKNGGQEHLKQRDYITWERILSHDLPKRYEDLMKQEIRKYAMEVGKDIIKNNSPIVGEGKVFSLPIGDHNDVVLDFGNIGNTRGKTTEEILKLYEQAFDSIYKDGLISKIGRELTSKKGLIDISGTILGGAAAVKVSAGTWGAGIPVATLVFTATENLYRAGMYELFDIEGGWQAGVGIDLENESIKAIIQKKGIEMVSTATLFSLFRFTGWSEQKILQYINNPSITSSVMGKISNYGIKTGVEGAFFTYFTVMSSNMQDTIKNGGNAQEYLDSFTNVGNMEDLTKLFAYNLGFITAVKGGAKIAEKSMILGYEKGLQTLVKELNGKGYTLINGRFYKDNNEVPVLLMSDFQKFTELNRKIAYISGDSYIKPENGRGGKTFNTNLVDPTKRYERLERNAKETQAGKIGYALHDKTIGETLQTSGLQNGKGVGEGLLKKSGFSNEEIVQFRQGKLKGEKTTEIKALGEMEKAMEVVYREYLEGVSKIGKGLGMREAFPNVDKKLLPKLYSIITKESTGKKERL